MELDEALAVLGLEHAAVDGAVSLTDARRAFRALVASHHPDRMGPGGAGTTVAVIDAFRALRAAAGPDGTILVTGVVAAPVAPGAPSDIDGAGHGGVDEPSAVVVLSGEVVAIGLSAPAAFEALHEAAGEVGHVSYVDRTTGIIETVLRFEGGPSCSVLLTLQRRALYTEVHCTMESIEAAPTPPIDPVLQALAGALRDTIG